MSKKCCDRVRRPARPKQYKQAGAVAEALRRRGVSAHVKPSWTGSLRIRVADPAATADYLDAHAAAIADALLADGISLSSGGRDFTIVPVWRGPADDAAAIGGARRMTDDPRPESDPPLDPQPPASLSAGDALDTFLHGYKMGRLAGVLDDLRHHLVLSGPQDDGGFELRLAPGDNAAAVRAQLHRRSAACAAALGAAACRIGGAGRRITITPIQFTVGRSPRRIAPLTTSR
jgi:hypothetical protein